MAGTTDWKALVAQKLSDQISRIPKEWIIPESISSKVSAEAPISAFDLLDLTSILTPRERELTEKYDATTLIEMMLSKTITSLEVTTAFCKRAAIAQQLTKCLTEILFREALDRASQCDKYLEEEGKPIGPFHGMPVSVKDMYHIKGQASTLGFVSYLKKPVAHENSFIVDMLLEGGAILYCKTNVPQALFVMESRNNVFGTTLNPYKLTLTSAGSSSGEGALVGFRGSLLGIGTDLGGSIRAPALCNGTFGYKPTAHRLPVGRLAELIRKGWPGPQITAGPHATSARDLTLLCKNIIKAKPWTRDSTSIAIPWREVPRKEKLKIGVWMGDAEFPITPPVARSLRAAAEKLAREGHNIDYLQCPSLMKSAKMAAPGFRFDLSGSLFQSLADGEEEPTPELLSVITTSFNDKTIDLEAVWDFNADLEDYREEWAKLWRENELDVLICPGSRQVAPPHGQYGPPLYTTIWNYLDMPASVIPYLKADRSLDSMSMAGYDVDAVDGAPCSVQVVGWRFQDEETLMATEIISDSLYR